MKITGRKSIIGLLLVILLVISLFFLNKISGRFSSGEHALKKIPPFIITDINGHSFRSSDMKGNAYFIQLIIDNEDIGSFLNVYNEWIKEGLFFLLAVRDPANFIKEVGPLPDSVVISKDYDVIETVFKSLSFNRISCLLVDRNLHLVFSSPFVSENEDLRLALNKLLRGEYFSINELFPLGANINEIEWLDQLLEIKKENDNHPLHIFSAFTTICDSCPSGVLASSLDRLLLGYSNMNVVILVPNHFSVQDVTNMKSQLKLALPIYRAEHSFWERWDQLIKRYGASEVTNIVLIVGKDGNINSVYWQECNCYSEILDTVKSIAGRAQ